MTSSNNHTCNSGCACQSCRARTGQSDELLPHWRLRRQQRLGNPVNPKQRASATENEFEFENEYPSTPNPVRHFHGITPKQVIRRKPKKWRVVNSRTMDGWVMLDENGKERIRFMRPNPRYKGFKQDVKWEHIKTGYWVVRDEHGNYLDGFGNIVAGPIKFSSMTEHQKRSIHIPYSGVDRELEFIEL